MKIALIVKNNDCNKRVFDEILFIKWMETTYHSVYINYGSLIWIAIKVLNLFLDHLVSGYSPNICSLEWIFESHVDVLLWVHLLVFYFD